MWRPRRGSPLHPHELPSRRSLSVLESWISGYSGSGEPLGEEEERRGKTETRSSVLSLLFKNKNEMDTSESRTRASGAARLVIGNFRYVELNSVSEVQGFHAERESTAVDPKVPVDSTRVHRQKA